METEVNEAKLREVVDFLERNPEKWDQHRFYNNENVCNTTGCIAGWTVELNGRANELYFEGDDENLDVDYDDIAQDILGLTTEQAYDIFYFFTSDWQDMKNRIKEVTGVAV